MINGAARRAAVALGALSIVAVLGAAKADPPVGRFVLTDANVVVHDTKTDLRWERTPSSALQSRGASLTYCSGLPTAGGGWRVPTLKELLTIVDWAATAPPVFPAAFFDGPVGDYWASSKPYQADGERHYVRFATGAAGASDSGTKYVRCVR